jgi:hypothetical protein
MIGHCLIAIRGSAQNVETENDDTLGYKRPEKDRMKQPQWPAVLWTESDLGQRFMMNIAVYAGRTSASSY